MKNAILWDVVPCSSCVKRSFGGTYRIHLQDRNISPWLQTEIPDVITILPSFVINVLQFHSCFRGSYQRAELILTGTTHLMFIYTNESDKMTHISSSRNLNIINLACNTWKT
jgi:hypothetical protein